MLGADFSFSAARQSGEEASPKVSVKAISSGTSFMFGFLVWAIGHSVRSTYRNLSPGAMGSLPALARVLLVRRLVSIVREISVQIHRSCRRQTADLHALASVATTTVISRTMLICLGRISVEIEEGLIWFSCEI